VSPAQAPCQVDEALGVFVSPAGSDETGDGTREAPWATLGNALIRARLQSKRVYACASAGPFVEAVSFDKALDNSALYGGFDCADWSYLGSERTRVASPSARALVAEGLTSLVIEDFAFTAADATEAGESSVGAWLVASSGVVLRRVELVAGAGADGADGAGTTDAATAGRSGAGGNPACNAAAAPNLGAGAVETLCDRERSGSIGGDGGDGGTTADNRRSSAGSGNAGLPASPMGATGSPGIGEFVGAWSCDVGNGHVGADGTSAPPAAGGRDKGTLSSAGFLGAPGADGSSGTVGQGGGGGGGAMAPIPGCGVLPWTGASGGSGGGGGCGGRGGTGGAGGGASFAIVSIDSSVTLESATLVSGLGGRGGAGGFGQPGGPGGNGGDGALGMNQSHGSCRGGQGGQGGNGAHGGGGAGGPSAGIAVLGAGMVMRSTDTAIQLPKAGAPGGADGAGATRGTTAGSAGVVGAVLAY
jgi:hypothetical protein